ncbi:MAG: histidine kinase [Ignavibacteria bacterium]|nr:histidine kinase [Ignavibacteria bacterium]
MKNEQFASDELIFESTISKKMYSSLRRNYFIRLIILYLLPFAFIIIYFHYQYNDLMTKSREMHLMSVAENQSRIIDIFLYERINNILSIIQSPDYKYPIDKKNLNDMLQRLKRNSDAFIDMGYFDTTSIQLEYSGPLSFLEKKEYGNESWFKDLVLSSNNFVITNIYQGLRKTPHFTIGVKLTKNNKRIIFKVSLDPQKIYKYMTSFEKSNDVYILIVNKESIYQLVPNEISSPMSRSPFITSKLSGIGIDEFKLNKEKRTFAFSWISGVDWAVIVIEKEFSIKSYYNLKIELILSSITILLLLFLIIIIRSKNIVKTEKEKQIAKHQLEQASKLATVGELASGIAHEIGNPLNIIANEVGIMQDYANPKFNSSKTLNDLELNFKKIINAVYRIKDINNKLLTFVRKNENELSECNFNEIIEDLVSGFLEREMKVDNIEIIRKYSKNFPTVLSDNNQMKQVLINLLNNAHDAIEGSGQIIFVTSFDSEKIYISVSDTGVGIPEDKINKIFLPFYTTKPVGKGTGLGLSVSFSIIKNLGGSIKVESKLGKGTTFTIEFPLNSKI